MFSSVLHANATQDDSDCVEWANEYLGECVVDQKQMAGLILGLMSIGFWLVAQAPQLIMNYKTSNAQSLSLIFLADWLAGDITNLVGCLLTNQVPTQLYTSIYFCVIDSLMLTQKIYYTIKNKNSSKKKVLNSFLWAGVFLALPFFVVSQLQVSSEPIVNGAGAGIGFDGKVQHRGRALLEMTSFHGTKNIIGYAIGCISGLMYFTSRLPQIKKNYQRKSTKGLSLWMFLMAVMGNLTYALGILLQSVEVDFIVDHLPWLVGSIGTLCFDFTIFCQFLLYRKNDRLAKVHGTEKQPLLHGQLNGGSDSARPSPIPDKAPLNAQMSKSPIILPYSSKKLYDDGV